MQESLLMQDNSTESVQNSSTMSDSNCSVTDIGSRNGHISSKDAPHYTVRGAELLHEAVVIRASVSAAGATRVFFRAACLEWETEEGRLSAIAWEDVIGASQDESADVRVFAVPMAEVDTHMSRIRRLFGRQKQNITFFAAGEEGTRHNPAKSNRSRAQDKNRNRYKRKLIRLLLRAPDDETSMEWVREIRRRALGVEQPHTRVIRVVMNPHGGNGLAKELFDKRVAPLFSAAGITLHVTPTQYAGHAVDMGRTYQVGEAEGVVFVSGDGTVQQFLQGLLSRDDWRYVISRVPIASIPSGTQNALAVGLRTTDPASAVHAVLKCRLRPLDAILITNGAGKTMISVCGVGWGVAGDIAAASESCRSVFRLLRCSGTLRYAWLKAAKGFFCRKPHPARVQYTTHPIRPVLVQGNNSTGTSSDISQQSNSGANNETSRTQHSPNSVRYGAVFANEESASETSRSLPSIQAPHVDTMRRSSTVAVTQEEKSKQVSRTLMRTASSPIHHSYVGYSLDDSRAPDWNPLRPAPRGSLARAMTARQGESLQIDRKESKHSQEKSAPTQEDAPLLYTGPQLPLSTAPELSIRNVRKVSHEAYSNMAGVTPSAPPPAADIAAGNPKESNQTKRLSAVKESEEFESEQADSTYGRRPSFTELGLLSILSRVEGETLESHGTIKRRMQIRRQRLEKRYSSALSDGAIYNTDGVVSTQSTVLQDGRHVTAEHLQTPLGGRSPSDFPVTVPIEQQQIGYYRCEEESPENDIRDRIVRMRRPMIEWRSEEGAYITVGGLNTAQDGFAVHPADGHLDLVLAREGNCLSMMGLSCRYICGLEYDSPLLDYVKATAVIVDPVHPRHRLPHLSKSQKNKQAPDEHLSSRQPPGAALATDNAEQQRVAELNIAAGASAAAARRSQHLDEAHSVRVAQARARGITEDEDAADALEDSDVIEEDRRDAVNVDGEVLYGPGPFMLQVLPSLVTAYGEKF